MNDDMSAIATKDRLWSMLNGAEDKMDFLDKAELVMTTVTLTQGFWVQENYCYKVVELVKLIDDQCREYLGHCQHAQTIKRIVKVQKEAWAVSRHFYGLHQARMDPICPDRLMSMSDIELAS